MRIAVPREIKKHEYRVALTPAGVHELAQRGHEVFIETGAGAGSAISDEQYLAAGAKILPSAVETWAEGELVLKVKEPVADEYPMLTSGQVLFTYLHLAADRALTDALLRAGTTSIAYETVQSANGSLPLLAPMSEVAGRLAPQVGAYSLMKPSGGRGVLPGGVPGVHPARVVVIGGGVAGLNAARIALGLGSDVEVLDTNVDRLREIDTAFAGRIRTVTSNALSLDEAVAEADLVIGAVLIAGAKAPKLVSNELVSRMRPGSVLVDISIDQGGCFADSRPTTHDEPTYLVHDSVFYCVANMPGAVPRTSTYALTNVTLPYALRLADRGWRTALRDDPALAKGLNTHEGALTNAAVGTAHELPSTTVEL
ncbi:alanine dehydrogenase [Prauserella marina]|uniref:Alanine dehydrogenase n=1 Tax=Prauserella marina TaxID=530584 RepID=A0A222W0E0_9PSEU|nr:alanine dehydrogenase [Prauserella marina]ASR39667.1 alanine dehydrogenase [Prauserella marina]PWV73082.1 alanine dehydrogenase [Prauserella marina]SDD72315.1 alanine dehydrogenase [Prauserella marina]